MATWTIDTAHSAIEFKVKYLLISTVAGAFTRFDARLDTDSEDFSNAKISFSAEIASITTNNKERDVHLKSDDFFSADAYPRLSFRSTSFQKMSDTDYLLLGELTLRNHTKPISLEVVYGGKAKDAQGKNRAGFEITGKISRKEFGLTWDAVTETGGIIVGDEIKLLFSVQMVES